MSGSAWGICPGLQNGQSGWVLRRRGDPRVGRVFRLLFFPAEAEALEMQRYLRSGLTVEQGYAKQRARIGVDVFGARRGARPMLMRARRRWRTGATV